jgi:hypothetical protein
MLQKGFSSELIVSLSQNLYHNTTSPGYKHTTSKHLKGHLHATSHEIMNKEVKTVPVLICIDKVALASREHGASNLPTSARSRPMNPRYLRRNKM